MRLTLGQCVSTHWSDRREGAECLGRTLFLQRRAVHWRGASSLGWGGRMEESRRVDGGG